MLFFDRQQDPGDLGGVQPQVLLLVLLAGDFRLTAHLQRPELERIVPSRRVPPRVRVDDEPRQQYSPTSVLRTARRDLAKVAAEQCREKAILQVVAGPSSASSSHSITSGTSQHGSTA